MISLTLIWYFTSIHLFLLLSMPANFALEIKCLESERQGLLSFKQSLIDRYDILSSWRTQANANDDCCNWRGVGCSNKTGGDHHIIRLHLHNKGLMGEVGSSLTQLSHLTYLDLSYNEFDQISLQDIASLINLNYLNLSNNKFSSVVIPSHLGNLSKLLVLDLGSNGWLCDNLSWLSRLSSLKHLDLSSTDLHNAHDWVDIINKLTLLQSLSLSNSTLPQPILSPHDTNANFSKFLVKLNLSLNHDLNSSIIDSWLINFSNSLTHLDLAYNNLQGFNMDGFGNMTSLIFLNLHSTKVDFHSSKLFDNLCNLNSLEVLYLGSNNFSGSLPNFSLLFQSLKELDLSNNKLSGTIPQSLGQLSNLENLNLQSNLLEGEVSEVHFSKLKNLKALDLSGNLLRLNFNSAWVPPFQLQSITLRNCTLGPQFPRWLQTQDFRILDISETGISDKIPRWFWNNLSPNLLFLDVSFNNIKGEVPNLSLKFKKKPVIILGVNEFEGKTPAFLFGAQNLDLSRNGFSDISSLCEVTYSSPLYLLDICGNQISGQLPNCWNRMMNLSSLSLAYNYFSGEIPHSLGNLTTLKSLNLRENYFSGEFPSWFNFTDLIIFDAAHNNLSGNLPSWIGSRLPNLVRLLLKSNHFHGNLPSTLCNLRRIEVLDISLNYNISGTIPTCIYNFDVLAKTFNPSTVPDYMRDLVMMWKGKENLIHGRNLQLQRSIDLSSNHLRGEIPNKITQLVGLISLNLSRNELTGQIPYNIDQLQSLDFLDLSRNNLSGPIPSGISQIPRLSVLDLSYNNLSGNIPTGTQLQSFPVSSYEGNPYLCGEPLKKCEVSNNNNENDKADQDKLIMPDLLIPISSGFIIGFWGIFGSLLFKRWRHTYFKLLSNIIEKVLCSN